MRTAGPITAGPSGARVCLRVQPRASRDEIAGVAGGALRVRLRAPPVEGAANHALLRFLADRLDVSRASLTLVSGRTARTKLIEVRGLSAEDVGRRLGL